MSFADIFEDHARPILEQRLREFVWRDDMPYEDVVSALMEVAHKLQCARLSEKEYHKLYDWVCTKVGDEFLRIERLTEEYHASLKRPALRRVA